jgi:diacylglycerol kinase family enzyme
VAVVANPTKIDNLAATAVLFAQACAQADLDPPAWHRTTIDDPGHGQTRAALARGASAVVAYGGDGTVRAVAAELAGSEVPLGVIPAGTGNLLARNLTLPLTDVDEALSVALGQNQRRVDVVRVEVDVSGEDDDPHRDTFCVMAGIGFDAEVMASVAPQLKERVGWWAYLLAGARKITGNRTRVTLRLDDDQVLHRQVRSVIVGNCGELTGGVRLMPSAAVDDGWLDVAVVTPRGVVGWGAVIATVLTGSRRDHPVVQHLRCRRIEIRAERPLHVQLDGDPVGTARALRAAVRPGALVVRCP